MSDVTSVQLSWVRMAANDSDRPFRRFPATARANQCHCCAFGLVWSLTSVDLTTFLTRIMSSHSHTHSSSSDSFASSPSKATYRVILCCLGNICRSPIAEAAIKEAVKALKYPVTEWCVQSRGTGGWHVGESADASSIEVCAKHGISISDHRAKQLCTADFQHYDYILAMDESNLKNIRRAAPRDGSSIAEVAMYLPNSQEVPDPWGESLSSFEHVFKLCTGEAQKWVKHIKESVDKKRESKEQKSE
jgi:protein-tyrosine phosphatase